MGKINFDVWVATENGPVFVEWKSLPGSDPDADDIGVTPEDVLAAAGYFPSSDEEFDPDDEELDETPPDVIAALGFDPKELSDDL